MIETYVETEHDFARALALEQDRRNGRRIPRHTYWPKALLYSEHVRYADQLRRYHDAFGRERVLVLVYEDFRADNEAAVRRVQRFLGVDDTLPVVPSRANPTVEMRSAAAAPSDAFRLGRHGPRLAGRQGRAEVGDAGGGPARACARRQRAAVCTAPPRRSTGS